MSLEYNIEIENSTTILHLRSRKVNYDLIQLRWYSM